MLSALRNMRAERKVSLDIVKKMLSPDYGYVARRLAACSDRRGKALRDGERFLRRQQARLEQADEGTAASTAVRSDLSRWTLPTSQRRLLSVFRADQFVVQPAVDAIDNALFLVPVA